MDGNNKKRKINKVTNSRKKYEFKSEKRKKMIISSTVLGLGIAAVLFGLSIGGYKLYSSLGGLEKITKNASSCKSSYGYGNCRYARNATVKQIQEMLYKLGYLKKTSDYNDGNFGPKTREAVIRFQKAKGKAAVGDADGYVGPRTMAALKEATSTSTNSSKPTALATKVSTTLSATKLNTNTERIKISVKNTNTTSVYFKWKTYSNGNLSWDKGKCILVGANKTVNTYGDLTLNSTRFGRVYIYLDSSCANQLSYKQTGTYNKPNSASNNNQELVNDISISFSTNYDTSVIENTKIPFNIYIKNTSNSNYYYKWKTYLNGNLNWDKGDCKLAKSKINTTATSSLQITGNRYGRIYIYSDSSCTKQVTYSQTSTYKAITVATYNQGDNTWGSSSYGCSKTNFRSNGCFPTSVAIATKTLTGSNNNPKTIANIVNKKGKYCNSTGHVQETYLKAVANEYGFTTTSYKHTKGQSYNNVSNEIKTNLNTGKSIILAQLYCPNKNALCSCSNCGHSIIVYPSVSNGYISYSDPNGGKKKSAKLDMLVKNVMQHKGNAYYGYYILTKK